MSWSSTAAFYDQLRSLLNAGMPIGQALDLAAGAAGRPHRQLGPRWSAGCIQGRSLSDQLAAAVDSGEETALVAALVRAGEASGKLPEMCGEIAAYYRHAIALRSLVIGRLAYPTLLIHVALVAAAVPAVFMYHYPALLLLAGPACLWLAVGGCALALRLASRDALARLALAWPLHGLTQPLVAGTGCLVLRAALGAGMLVPAALELAAGACPNRVVTVRLADAARGVATGAIPSLTAALGGCGFPAEVVQLVANGEHSGTLEATLARCTILQQERFRTRSEWTARIATGTVYGLTMLVGALVVIGFYAGYIGMIRQAADGE
jgi:type II secretory pathway component PulF